MQFNSLEFILFLPLVIALYYAFNQRFKWIILLAASYYFYMAWEPAFVTLILASTLVDYIAGVNIHKSNKPTVRKAFLLSSIFVNLGILVAFKYNDFFIENINEIITASGGRSQISLLRWILPMGISFYTFQTLSYTIDVYKKRIEAERHLGYFALYVCYFPQLVAGPIERAQNLLHQFKSKINLTYENFSWGFKQMIWGFFKKMVIADRLAPIVDQVYNNPEQHEGLSLILGTYLFAIQIYCDFSGYSDIAIGVSRMLGIDLRINFRLPYIAKSFNDFWRRWHISLSTWFRDYLYIPLGGNRVKKWRWLLNIFLVFLISGFWHGAQWTFVIWGGLHGTYLIIEHLLQPLTQKKKSKLKTFFAKIIIFHLVVFAWIFFRANSVEDAFHIVSNLATWNLETFWLFIAESGALNLAFIVGLLLLFILSDKWVDGLIKENSKQSYLKNQLVFSFITALILLFGHFGETKFIYFQF
ncbi:MBOAT family protein [bacterium AH-315-B15]|nr:MBOAT family protein [bacterium AH-315-B15]